MSIAEPTLGDVVKLLAEGNPGALDVLCRIAARDDCEELLVQLHRRRISGSEIWRRYLHDHDEDLEAFCEGLR